VTDKPLSILHVLAPAEAGGLETVVRSLAEGHSAHGHLVEIAAVVDDDAHAFVQQARDTGLTVHTVQSPPRSIRPERRAIAALLSTGRFDVMHSHGYRSDILNLRTARRMRVPSVTTLHGFSATDRKARAYEWLQLRGARNASAIVAVSTNVSNRVLASGARPQSLRLIRNAVRDDVEWMDVAPARARLNLSDGLNIGWIGRLSYEKGPDVMIETMKRLGDLPVTVSFVGDGPDRDALTRSADQAGGAERVRFHGRVDNASTLSRAFDLIVLSSRTEGTPMVLLEAMAAGVPIVATRVGGVPDMLTSDEAILVPPEDPEALAAGIRAALGDSIASERRSSRAHDRLTREFGIEKWLSRYESLYRSIQPPLAGAFE
jgi:glycosyltransferase involved in cell wall biosynthesis